MSFLPENSRRFLKNLLTSTVPLWYHNQALTAALPVDIRRDVRVVEGTGLENRRCASIRGFESHSLRHLFSYVFYLRKYPRGRRGSPAKGVGWIKPARGFKSLLPRHEKVCNLNDYRLFCLPLTLTVTLTGFFNNLFGYVHPDIF